PADSSIGRPSPHSPYTTLFRSTPPSLNSRSSSSGTQTASTSAPGRQGSATSAVGGRKSPTEVGSEGASDAVGTGPPSSGNRTTRSEEHTSELQSRENIVCRLLL